MSGASNQLSLILAKRVSMQLVAEVISMQKQTHAFHCFKIVQITGISNKTLSLFSSKLASYVQILVQISSPYRQLKSAKKWF